MVGPLFMRKLCGREGDASMGGQMYKMETFIDIRIAQDI